MESMFKLNKYILLLRNRPESDEQCVTQEEIVAQTIHPQKKKRKYIESSALASSVPCRN